MARMRPPILPRLLYFSLLSLLSCSPTAEQRSPTQAPPAASTQLWAMGDAPTGWDEKPWGRFHSKRFSLWLSLPDGKEWRIDDHRTSWLSASHPLSSSSLSLRIFLEEEATNAARCEARARQNDPALPTEKQAKALKNKVLKTLPDWDTRAQFFLLPLNQPGQPLDLEGHLVAFAASNRKCMVFHYATRAIGASADAVIGARVADAEEWLSKIEVVDELRGPGPIRP